MGDHHHKPDTTRQEIERFVLAPPWRWWLFCHLQPATAAATAGKPSLLLWWLRWRLVLVVARGWSSFGGVVVPAVKRQRGCGDGGGWCSGDDGVAVHGRDMVGKWEAPAGWRRLPPWWCQQW
nr:cytochrome P450 CYP82D47-like [Tanacetum cinerariifolium]